MQNRLRLLKKRLFGSRICRIRYWLSRMDYKSLKEYAEEDL